MTETHWGIEYRDKRYAIGLTQARASVLAGVSQQTVSMIECGLRNPSPSTAAKLLGALEAHRVQTA